MQRFFATAILALASTSLAAAQAGSYTFAGAGCGSASIQARGVPTLGQTFTVSLPPNLAPVDGPQSFLLMGFRALPTPVDIGALTGNRPCGPEPTFCGMLFSSVDYVESMPFLNGGSRSATFSIAIPNNPALVGAVFFQQNLTIGSGFGPRCVDLSRAGIGTIGR